MDGLMENSQDAYKKTLDYILEYASEVKKQMWRETVVYFCRRCSSV